MYAIKVTPNKRRPDDNFLLRDSDDFVVHVWTRKSEAEKALRRINHPSCAITRDINRAALERATAKKQRLIKEQR